MTLQERLHLLRRCPELNVSVVPYGLDINALPRARYDSDVEQILLTGCYTESADQEGARWFITQVWPQLSARCPQLNLCVCGNEAVKALRSIGSRQSRVRLVDTTSVVPEEVERSQIFVSPTQSGAGFQGRVLRMLGAGLPVVATSASVEGIPLMTGVTAMLADTPHTMQETIQLVAKDSVLRRELGSNARDMVARQFSWHRCVDSLEQVLESVVRA